MENCLSCRYMRHGVDGDSTDKYWCHRYAPKPGVASRCDLWPEVRSSDWCGEWAETAVDRAERIQRMNAENLRRIREVSEF